MEGLGNECVFIVADLVLSLVYGSHWIIEIVGGLRVGDR